MFFVPYHCLVFCIIITLGNNAKRLTLILSQQKSWLKEICRQQITVSPQTSTEAGNENFCFAIYDLINNSKGLFWEKKLFWQSDESQNFQENMHDETVIVVKIFGGLKFLWARLGKKWNDFKSFLEDLHFNVCTCTAVLLRQHILSVSASLLFPSLLHDPTLHLWCHRSFCTLSYKWLTSWTPRIW